MGQSIGGETGYMNQGPYWAYQIQIPIIYRYNEQKESCNLLDTAGDLHKKTFYIRTIRPIAYGAAAAHVNVRLGKNVSSMDGYQSYAASPTKYRVTVSPGSYYTLSVGTSLTYGVAASVFGVGISAETVYTKNHYLRIAAGHGRYGHVIFSFKCNPYDVKCEAKMGTFYSF